MKIKRILRRVLKILYFIWVNSNKTSKAERIDVDEYQRRFRNYWEFCEENSDVQYEAELKNVNLPDSTYKYVGGIYWNERFIATPNKADAILCFSNEITETIGKLENDNYKWTGETIYNDKVYFFPRKASNMLVLDNEYVSEMSGENYGKEHHYGGIRWESLIIQPPRSTSHFLVWDLQNKMHYKVQIGPECLSSYFRYNCSLLHPNGYIYFFPENGRVVKLNPRTFDFSFVGNWIDTMIFDAKVLPDGNIYGFSTNNSGIIKYDVLADRVEILHRDQVIGAYGTKLGVNGKLYSIPGSGSCIWEYNYLDNSLKILYDLNDKGYAKYAGGCTSPDGNIYAAPAFAEKLLMIVPDRLVEIPKEIYELFWSDCY